MARDYIDFISAYCDRWCERCAFTNRCSAYAVDIAAAMCGGDFETGLVSGAYLLKQYRRDGSCSRTAQRGARAEKRSMTSVDGRRRLSCIRNETDLQVVRGGRRFSGDVGCDPACVRPAGRHG